MSASVSESIGKLLLEGCWQMLADSCDVCYTVLMQDRRGRVICVKCESAARANAVQPDVRGSGKITNGSVNNGIQNHEETTVISPAMLNGLNSDNGNSPVLQSCEEVILNEMQNTTTALRNLSQLQHDMQGKLLYIRYLRECAETIQALRGIKKA